MRFSCVPLSTNSTFSMKLRIESRRDTMHSYGAAGTVTNVKEAIAWLSYTYLYVRMMQNPLPYGLSWQELAADPRLDARR